MIENATAIDAVPGYGKTTELIEDDKKTYDKSKPNLIVAMTSEAVKVLQRKIQTKSEVMSVERANLMVQRKIGTLYIDEATMINPYDIYPILMN